MGEFADYAVDEAQDMDDLRLDYRMGLISDAEAYDAGLIDELGFMESRIRSTNSVTCRHCRKRLQWRLTEGGWRTSEADGSIHRCPKFARAT